MVTGKVKYKDNNKEHVPSNLFLIITQLVAAVTKLFTFNATNVIFTLNMEHGILGGTATPSDSAL